MTKDNSRIFEVKDENFNILSKKGNEQRIRDINRIRATWERHNQAASADERIETDNICNIEANSLLFRINNSKLHDILGFNKANLTVYAPELKYNTMIKPGETVHAEFTNGRGSQFKFHCPNIKHDLPVNKSVGINTDVENRTFEHNKKLLSLRSGQILEGESSMTISANSEGGIESLKAFHENIITEFSSFCSRVEEDTKPYGKHVKRRRLVVMESSANHQDYYDEGHQYDPKNSSLKFPIRDEIKSLHNDLKKSRPRTPIALDIVCTLEGNNEKDVMYHVGLLREMVEQNRSYEDLKRAVEGIGSDEQQHLVSLREYIITDFLNPCESMENTTTVAKQTVFELNICRLYNTFIAYCDSYHSQLESAEGVEKANIIKREKAARENLDDEVYTKLRKSEKHHLNCLKGIVLQEKNQINKRKLQRPEKCPAVQPFESKILTVEQLEYVLDGKILSSFQRDLLLQVEDLILNIGLDGNSKKAKPLGFLDTGEGKTFVAGVIQRYNDVINSETALQKLLSCIQEIEKPYQKRKGQVQTTMPTPLREENIRLNEEHRKLRNISQNPKISDASDANKMRLQDNLRHGSFKIKNINLANQDDLYTFIFDKKTDEKHSSAVIKKKVRGTLFVIDEGQFFQKKNKDLFVELVKHGAQVINFGASVNKLKLLDIEIRAKAKLDDAKAVIDYLDTLEDNLKGNAILDENSDHINELRTKVEYEHDYRLSRYKIALNNGLLAEERRQDAIKRLENGTLHSNLGLAQSLMKSNAPKTTDSLVELLVGKFKHHPDATKHQTNIAGLDINKRYKIEGELTESMWKKMIDSSYSKDGVVFERGIDPFDEKSGRYRLLSQAMKQVAVNSSRNEHEESKGGGESKDSLELSVNLVVVNFVENGHHMCLAVAKEGDSYQPRVFLAESEGFKQFIAERSPEGQSIILYAGKNKEFVVGGDTHELSLLTPNDVQNIVVIEAGATEYLIKQEMGRNRATNEIGEQTNVTRNFIIDPLVLSMDLLRIRLKKHLQASENRSGEVLALMGQVIKNIENGEVFEITNTLMSKLGLKEGVDFDIISSSGEVVIADDAGIWKEEVALINDRGNQQDLDKKRQEKFKAVVEINTLIADREEMQNKYERKNRSNTIVLNKKMLITRVKDLIKADKDEHFEHHIGWYLPKADSRRALLERIRKEKTGSISSDQFEEAGFPYQTTWNGQNRKDFYVKLQKSIEKEDLKIEKYNKIKERRENFIIKIQKGDYLGISDDVLRELGFKSGVSADDDYIRVTNTGEIIVSDDQIMPNELSDFLVQSERQFDDAGFEEYCVDLDFNPETETIEKCSIALPSQNPIKTQRNAKLLKVYSGLNDGTIPYSSREQAIESACIVKESHSEKLNKLVEKRRARAIEINDTNEILRQNREIAKATPVPQIIEVKEEDSHGDSFDRLTSSDEKKSPRILAAGGNRYMTPIARRSQESASLSSFGSDTDQGRKKSRVPHSDKKLAPSSGSDSDLNRRRFRSPHSGSKLTPSSDRDRRELQITSSTLEDIFTRSYTFYDNHPDRAFDNTDQRYFITLSKIFDPFKEFLQLQIDESEKNIKQITSRNLSHKDDRLEFYRSFFNYINDIYTKLTSNVDQWEKGNMDDKTYCLSQQDLHYKLKAKVNRANSQEVFDIIKGKNSALIDIKAEVSAMKQDTSPAKRKSPTKIPRGSGASAAKIPGGRTLNTSFSTPMRDDNRVRYGKGSSDAQEQEGEKIVITLDNLRDVVMRQYDYDDENHRIAYLFDEDGDKTNDYIDLEDIKKPLNQQSEIEIERFKETSYHDAIRNFNQRSRLKWNELNELADVYFGVVNLQYMCSAHPNKPIVNGEAFHTAACARLFSWEFIEKNILSKMTKTSILELIVEAQIKELDRDKVIQDRIEDLMFELEHMNEYVKARTQLAEIGDFEGIAANYHKEFQAINQRSLGVSQNLQDQMKTYHLSADNIIAEAEAENRELNDSERGNIKRLRAIADQYEKEFTRETKNLEEIEKNFQEQIDRNQEIVKRRKAKKDQETTLNDKKRSAKRLNDLYRDESELLETEIHQSAEKLTRQRRIIQSRRDELEELVNKGKSLHAGTAEHTENLQAIADLEQEIRRIERDTEATRKDNSKQRRKLQDLEEEVNADKDLTRKLGKRISSEERENDKKDRRLRKIGAELDNKADILDDDENHARKMRNLAEKEKDRILERKRLLKAQIDELKRENESRKKTLADIQKSRALTEEEKQEFINRHTEIKRLEGLLEKERRTTKDIQKTLNTHKQKLIQDKEVQSTLISEKTSLAKQVKLEEEKLRDKQEKEQQKLKEDRAKKLEAESKIKKYQEYQKQATKIKEQQERDLQSNQEKSAKLVRDKQSLESKLASLKKTGGNQKKSKEQIDLETAIAAHEKSLSELEKSTLSLKTSIQKGKNDSLISQSELESNQLQYTRALYKLKRERERLKLDEVDRIENLKSENERLEKQVETDRQKVEQLGMQQEDQQGKLRSLAEKIADIKKKIGSVGSDEENSGLNSELKILQDKFDAKQLEKLKRDSEIAKLKATISNNVALLEISEINSDNYELMLQKLLIKVQHLQTQISEFDTIDQASIEEKERLIEQLRLLKERSKNITDENLDSFKEDIISHMKQAQELAKKLSEELAKKREVSNSTTNIIASEEELMKLRKKIQDLKRDILNQKDGSVDLTHDLQEAKNAYGALVTQLFAQQQLKTQLKNEIRHLELTQKERENLSVHNSDSIIEHYNRLIESAKGKFNDREINDLRAQRDELSRTVHDTGLSKEGEEKVNRQLDKLALQIQRIGESFTRENRDRGSNSYHYHDSRTENHDTSGRHARDLRRQVQETRIEQVTSVVDELSIYTFSKEEIDNIKEKCNGYWPILSASNFSSEINREIDRDGRPILTTRDIIFQYHNPHSVDGDGLSSAKDNRFSSMRFKDICFREDDYLSIFNDAVIDNSVFENCSFENINFEKVDISAVRFVNCVAKNSVIKVGLPQGLREERSDLTPSAQFQPGSNRFSEERTGRGNNY